MAKTSAMLVPNFNIIKSTMGLMLIIAEFSHSTGFYYPLFVTLEFIVLTILHFVYNAVVYIVEFRIASLTEDNEKHLHWIRFGNIAIMTTSIFLDKNFNYIGFEIPRTTHVLVTILSLIALHILLRIIAGLKSNK